MQSASIRQLEQNPDTGRSFPVFLTPERKGTIEDAKALMRDHFAGTEHDPYGHGLRGDEPWRPDQRFSARMKLTSCRCVRGFRKEIGQVIYVALGMADLSVFIPFYAGLTSSGILEQGDRSVRYGIGLLEVPPPADARHDGLPEACADRA